MFKTILVILISTVSLQTFAAGTPPTPACLFGETTYPVFSAGRAGDQEGEKFRSSRQIKLIRDQSVSTFQDFNRLSPVEKSLIVDVARKELGMTNGQEALRYVFEGEGATISEIVGPAPSYVRYLYVGFYPGDNEYGTVFMRTNTFGRPSLTPVADVMDSDIYNCRVFIK